MSKNNLVLTPQAVEMINDLLRRGKNVELGMKRDKIVVWEVSSKTRLEITE